MKLLPHQVKFAKGYSDKGFLVHEGGTGKTVCACVWLADGRDDDALVVCPKRVVKKWQKALADWGTKATVLSKEEFKKQQVKEWSAIVVDEADEFASPLFVKGRSMFTEAMYNLIRAHDMPTLLLTATPVRSTPWNLHTLLTFYGQYFYWKEWRKRFFYLQQPDPYQFRYLQRPAYFKIPNWIEKINEELYKHADIVLLKDCVDYLPPVEYETIRTPPKGIFAPGDEVHPSAVFSARRKFEQNDKSRHIVAIGKEFRKVLVVAYYVEQCEELFKSLSKDRQTFMVHGSVKKQEEILEEANAYDGECFLIVQAELGAGFDADTFSVVVFASMSYKVRDYVQMKYRVRRIHNLHPVKYVFLHGGKNDEQVYNSVQEGKDFVPSEKYE